MKVKSSTALTLCDYHPAQGSLISDLLRGLRSTPRQISPMYFYDERGSQLFDQICELPEYYVTRTELGILHDFGHEIARCAGSDVLLVELGSGSSNKTRAMLDRLSNVATYVPVDISRSHLLAAARSISAAYSQIEVLPVCADFTRPFALPKPTREYRDVVVFFPGSTIGNFDHDAAVDLLRAMRTTAGPRGALIIGVDLVKDVAVLERAYDDAAGVTAAFNLNVLRRLNKEFGADFVLGNFHHRAVWNPMHSRIEMHLISTRKQMVTFADQTIELGAGEPIVTEHCHKYTPESFRELAAAGGWLAKRMWTDEQKLFSVHYLEANADG